MNCINGLHKCGVKFVVDHGCTCNGHLECNLVSKFKATRNVRMQSLDATTYKQVEVGQNSKQLSLLGKVQIPFIDKENMILCSCQNLD